ncbi:hypothetical protein Zmor_013101 [Zophobas morio]|uniref:Uncharacterized protein n=1 Tax=Zophobas morio TaxID=2755281 RepID=A0AA38MF70_9CUCU|nr:hypothetical protein Zmor_013101 [Zophobas morio]
MISFQRGLSLLGMSRAVRRKANVREKHVLEVIGRPADPRLPVDVAEYIGEFNLGDVYAVVANSPIICRYDYFKGNFYLEEITSPEKCQVFTAALSPLGVKGNGFNKQTTKNCFVAHI